MTYSDIISLLLAHTHLTAQQSHTLLVAIMQGELSSVQIGSLLTAFAFRSVSQEEITGFIQAMRENMISISAPGAIDVCGSGGDNKNTFNISTAVSLVCAGAGITVVKHGNHAASSTSGSADVLQALGVHISPSPQRAEQILKSTGIVFLYAPLYHQSMKQVSQVRKELKIRTIFNYLGPFTNPARVQRQLIGISDKTTARLLAEASRSLGYTKLFIAISDDGMDEISIFTKSTVYTIADEKMSVQYIDPREYGYTHGQEKDIQGGSPERNAEIISFVLSGGKGTCRDIVVFNSAFACLVAGKAKTVPEGIALAEHAIDSGSAMKVLNNLIGESKRYE